MRKKNLSGVLSLLLSLVLMGGCSLEKKEDAAPLATGNLKALSGYANLKERCRTDQNVMYLDFDKSLTVTKIATDQWTIGNTTWWFPTWNATVGPVIQDSYLVMTSQKSSTVSAKNETQSITAYPITPTGEFIIGYKSTRWTKGYEQNQNYWVDSSVGLECFYTDSHQSIVSVFGSMGVFKDPDGSCPGNSCYYASVTGWPAIALPGALVGIRIAWHTESNNTKTFELYVNDEKTPRASLIGMTFAFNDLRIRLNANVTDTNKLPAVDSDTLYIDYVCIKSHLTAL